MALSLSSPLHAFSQIKKPSSFSNLFFKRAKGVQQHQFSRWSCRKKDIHPKFYENAKVYCNGEHVMTTGGTQPEYSVDVWSGNHPFYLGSRSALLVDADQVEKFRKKFGGLTKMMEIPTLKYGEIVITKKKSGSSKGKGRK